MTDDHEQVRSGLAAFTNACDQRDAARAEVERLDAALQHAEAQNEVLREHHEKLSAQLGYYMRHCAELKTFIESGVKLWEEAQARARLGPTPTDEAMRLAKLETALQQETFTND